MAKKNKHMKNILLSLILAISLLPLKAQNAIDILQKVDKNMISKSKIIKSKMIINGRRNSRTIISISYTEGKEKSFTEYLSPEREKGTKMLKLKDRLWIYSPSTDRTIQLSGHMLKQSVMGSDLSYEDMMEDRKLNEMYNAKVTGDEIINNRKVWVLKLNAKVPDANYDSRKIWIDAERYVPIREELYAKSGKLLKKIELKDIKLLNGRWYPTNMYYKDVLKSGKGTGFIIEEIKFNANIEPHIFSKASLKK